jgi:hypothetical protein
MPTKLQQLLHACWQSPIFGDSYALPFAYERIEQRMAALAQAFATSFTPIVLRALPGLPLSTHVALIRETVLRVTGLCSITAVESNDVERLATAAVCFGLLSLGDTCIDRGDAAMEVALRLLLKEHAISLPDWPDICVGQGGSAPARVSTIARVRMPAAGAAAVQARLAALRQISTRLTSLSRREDVPVLLHTPCLGFFKHSLALRQLSQQLQYAGECFWEQHAAACVAHSVMNIQVFGDVGLIYAVYRQAHPELPGLATIAQETRLMRFLDRTANAAVRVFDDVGDQALDTGMAAGSQPHFNLFNHPTPELIRAFLRFADLTDRASVALATEALQSNTQQGDAAIVQLFVDLLRQRLAELPETTQRRYSTFLMLLKRFIESGYANAIGDQALSASIEAAA